MPTDTFFGLSEEKKKKVIEAGKKEFSEKTFELTSIKNIAEKAEISRASFYQYFNNKEDLLEYIIKNHFENKKNMIMKFMQKTKGDIFEICIYLYDDMIIENKSDRDMLIFTKIFHNVMQSKEKRILENNSFNIQEMHNLINTANLRIQSKEELIILIRLLIDITFKSILDSKVIEDKNLARDIFLKKIEFLKNGTVKK